MTLLEFARGPALEASLTVFALGVAWRLVGVLLLPWGLVRAAPREGARSAPGAALYAIVAKMWPYVPFRKTAAFSIFNSYVFHIGLAVIVFLGAPHILFIKSLTGWSWGALPGNVIAMVGVVTLASLAAALAHRLTSPVLRLISRPDDYISWAVTFLPVLTGLMAWLHLGARYETLLAWHILSLCAFFIWFPFGRLMHAFLVFVSRGVTGVRLGRRGAAI
jgi:nitrate reductase gamma subunit